MSTKPKKIRQENDKPKIQVSDNGKGRGKWEDKDESCIMAPNWIMDSIDIIK